VLSRVSLDIFLKSEPLFQATLEMSMDSVPDDLDLNGSFDIAIVKEIIMGTNIPGMNLIIFDCNR
jgi:hypothetical protein